MKIYTVGSAIHLLNDWGQKLQHIPFVTDQARGQDGRMLGKFSFCISMDSLISKRRFIQTQNQAPVVQKVDNAIQLINHYLVEDAIGFPNTYSLCGDLSGGSPIQLLNDWSLGNVQRSWAKKLGH